jgi:2-haloacid dehalogenase
MTRTLEIAQSVKALTFDTGGTVLDWHSGVLSAMQAQGAAQGLQGDWGALTKRWRRLSTGMVNDGLPQQGGRASMDMDDVLRVTLDQTLAEAGLDEISGESRIELVRAWRTLPAWPDVATGLRRLRAKYVITPFTILNTELVIQASRAAGLSWDCVISCEMIGVYKTHPTAYATAARWLGLKHEEILMVTTHNNDLRASSENGFHTAFVYRPDEWGDIPSLDPEPDPLADVVCRDFNDLADMLGCPPA